MTDNKYSRGKIYKLVNRNTEEGNVYYGSTITDLRYRKYGHKRDWEKWKEKNRGYITSFKLFEEDEEGVKIIIVENYACQSSYELHARERWYIENNKCLNKQIPTRTDREYYIDNKERISQRTKEFRKKNKEIISQRRKIKIDCDICGKNVNKNHIARHKRSLKCQGHKKD